MKMQKNKIKKEDDRYLIFYTFDDDPQVNEETKNEKQKTTDEGSES